MASLTTRGADTHSLEVRNDNFDGILLTVRCVRRHDRIKLEPDEARELADMLNGAALIAQATLAGRDLSDPLEVLRAFRDGYFDTDTDAQQALAKAMAR